MENWRLHNEQLTAIEEKIAALEAERAWLESLAPGYAGYRRAHSHLGPAMLSFSEFHQFTDELNTILASAPGEPIGYVAWTKQYQARVQTLARLLGKE